MVDLPKPEAMLDAAQLAKRGVAKVNSAAKSVLEGLFELTNVVNCGTSDLIRTPVAEPVPESVEKIRLIVEDKG